MKKAIIGAGGFAREVKASLCEDVVFFVEDEFLSGLDDCLPLSSFDPKVYEAVVAIGDPITRKRITESMPKETSYFTHVHPSAQILAKDVSIGRGSIVCANSIITTNVVIGEHCHINLSTTIGHDTIIGNYFTASPGVHISGNCKISDMVSMGTGSATREKISITNNVVIGMQSAVVNDINEPGTYVGVPCKRLTKR